MVILYINDEFQQSAQVDFGADQRGELPGSSEAALPPGALPGTTDAAKSG